MSANVFFERGDIRCSPWSWPRRRLQAWRRGVALNELLDGGSSTLGCFTVDRRFSEECSPDPLVKSAVPA